MAHEKPKHKPSPRHTLDEVLKSLQDLIRNDIVGGNPPGAPAGTVEPMRAPSQPGEPDHLDAALDALDNLITHELVDPAARARERQSEPAGHDLPAAAEAWTETEEITAAAAPEPDINASDGTGKDIATEWAADVAPPPGGLQVTFAFDDAPAQPAEDDALYVSESDEIAVTALEPAAEEQPSPEPPQAEPEPIVEAPPAALEQTETETVASAAPQTAISPDDDIPVLNEVAHEILAQSDSPLTPERTRELVIHVIARLNIELRKSGAQPLDARTINRLQQLLREALVSSPPKHQ